MASPEEQKRNAACEAVKQIKSGMVVGLGTGSTARYAVENIGQRIKNGELTDIVGIPSSQQTEKQARAAGITLSSFRNHLEIDITIDGADEVAPDFNVIKGGGGALLREKVLAQVSKQFIIIVDSSKLSPHLGYSWALPIEVSPFASYTEEQYLISLGAKVRLRLAGDGKPFHTDQGNTILDADFGEIFHPQELSGFLNERAGIAEHGLFIGLVDEVIIATEDQVQSYAAGDTRMREHCCKN